MAIVKRYTAGVPKVGRVHNTPLALEFMLTTEDCSIDEIAAKNLNFSIRNQGFQPRFKSTLIKCYKVKS
jgi:hypothetical protein